MNYWASFKRKIYFKYFIHNFIFYILQLKCSIKIHLTETKYSRRNPVAEYFLCFCLHLPLWLKNFKISVTVRIGIRFSFLNAVSYCLLVYFLYYLLYKFSEWKEKYLSKNKDKNIKWELNAFLKIHHQGEKGKNLFLLNS